jgi:CHASE2 domain-containing sensor protein
VLNRREQIIIGSVAAAIFLLLAVLSWLVTSNWKTFDKTFNPSSENPIHKISPSE